MNTRHETIRRRAEAIGLEVESNRPGDGTRRYVFTRPGGHTYSAVGAREAEIYLDGYIDSSADHAWAAEHPHLYRGRDVSGALDFVRELSADLWDMIPAGDRPTTDRDAARYFLETDRGNPSLDDLCEFLKQRKESK